MTVHPHLSLSDPAGRIFYKVYPFGTAAPTGTVVPDGSVSVTPWVTTTTTFDTISISPIGLYSVWVRAAHTDYIAGDAETGTLFKDTFTPANSETDPTKSFAIGTLLINVLAAPGRTGLRVAVSAYGSEKVLDGGVEDGQIKELPACPACCKHAGAAGQPTIVRVDEPAAAGSNTFVVWFKYPSNNNVQ